MVLRAENNDAEIIARVLQGERDEFRELVVRYQHQVFAMIMRQVGEREIAQDIAQEVFFRAYRKLATFRGESSFSTWLVRIALNLTTNYFQSRCCRERRQSQELAASIVVPEMLDENTAETQQALNFLQREISQLKPLYRDVIVICALERKSYEEAARILDIPIGTVRSRLNTARNMLRERVFAQSKA